jgi:leucyl-tRNA---protein transferase
LTEQKQTRVPQFYITPAGPCPYLPGAMERKVFAGLSGPYAASLNDTLTQAGFRRSQGIAYRPTCDGCSACISVRILAERHAPSRNERRVTHRNADLIACEAPAQATREQFALLRAYLDARHAGGGMSDMSLFDYAAMVEETPVVTTIFEYRTVVGELAACALTDIMPSGLSMVYSFYHPGMAARSLGTFMILDHIVKAKLRNLPYVYLGYWVEGSPKMAYKARFKPLEALGPGGWNRMP